MFLINKIVTYFLEIFLGIKLSLCIPTYNRALYIGETLDSIISQATDDVEIVIVDGASKDNTEEIVRGFQKQFPRLRYFRGETNMGVERDTHKAVALAEGEYCWLMTSDDVLKPDAIAVVMDAINQDYGLILVNAEVRNEDLSELLAEAKLGIDENLEYGLKDIEHLFLDTIDYLSYMGAVIIKRSIWDSREKEPYFDTDFVHVGVIFQDVIPEKKLVISAPLISIRYGTATWTSREFEIWGFNWPALIWSFEKISDHTKRQITKREGWLNFRRLITQRASGTFSFKEWNRWVRPVRGYTLSKILVLLISFLPGMFLNFLTVLYFSNRRDLNSRSTLIVLKRSRFYWYRHSLK